MLFFFLFVKKKIKCMTWGTMGGRTGKEKGRRKKLVGGGFGRDNKKYCTYNTVFHSSLSFI